MAQCDDEQHRRIFILHETFHVFKMIQVSNQAISKNVGREQPAPLEVSEYSKLNLMLEQISERISERTIDEVIYSYMAT
jgi:hypothetical protein